MFFGKKHVTVWSVAMALLFVGSLPSLAFLNPQDSPIADKSFRDPSINVRNGYLQASESAVAGHERVQRLSSLGVSPQHAYLDVRTGRWGTLLATAPLLPGQGTGNDLTWEGLTGARPGDMASLRQVAWEGFIGYLQANNAALGIDIAEIQAPGKITVHNDGEMIQIYAPRMVNGIRVHDSYLTGVIKHGNLILLGAINWADFDAPAAASLNAGAAQAKVAAHLGPLNADTFWGKSSLLYVPVVPPTELSQLAVGEGLGYRLVWAVRSTLRGDHGNYEAYVDAVDGTLLRFEDTNHYASTRKVIGGVLPVSNDGADPDGIEHDFPMPFADLEVGGENFFTDSGGNLLACVDGTITTTLSGKLMRMNDDCGAINESTAGDILDLGQSATTDCSVPPGSSPGNTRASRSGFYEMTRIKEQAIAQLPDNVWLKQQLTSNMNINNTCNAFWNGATVNFYRSGGGCNNTGELAGVFDHEWGHGMDNNDALPNIANPSEGIPDIYASLRLNTSCIGRNFRATNCGGYGDPCLDCSGVRDIDWANRNSGIPHDINSAFPTGIDALCGTGSGTPCGGSTHCEGSVYAESVWDLWNRDLTAAPFNMSLDTARELATKLTYIGGGFAGNWFQCGAGDFNGCNADGGYLNFIAADDNDGDLTNGTPNMSAIFAAFDRHGIACNVPTVTNSGCVARPSTAPTVSTTPLDRGMLLEWNDVGAGSYNVYRGEGVFACDFGKELLGTTSTTSFVDDNLMNGMEYYYIVIPVGCGGECCFGPASSCTAATPVAGANLAVLPGAMLTIDTGDGDDFVDNCEMATISFDVDNTGTGSLTNVAIASVRSTSHPGINSTITFDPVISASLADCDRDTGSFSFEGVDLAFNETVEFEILVTADELAGRTKSGFASVSQVESDFENFATRTFSVEADNEGWLVVEGTFDRDNSDTAGDGSFAFRSSSGLDAQCDRIRSPQLVLNNDSTLSLMNNYEIEPESGGTWYDRANVGVIEADGTRTLITPDGGRPYNADSSGPGNYTGCNEPEEGWADTEDTWGASSWSAGALQSATFAGQPIQLEVIYSTDAAFAVRGFWFDAVSVTNVDIQVPDTQPDCIVDFIFGDGFESGDTSAWDNDNTITCP